MKRYHVVVITYDDDNRKIERSRIITAWYYFDGEGYDQAIYWHNKIDDQIFDQIMNDEKPRTKVDILVYDDVKREYIESYYQYGARGIAPDDDVTELLYPGRHRRKAA